MDRNEREDPREQGENLLHEAADEAGYGAEADQQQNSDIETRHRGFT
jgi:hypothetical protein